MKLGITIAAILLGLAVVLAVTFKGPTASQNSDDKDAQAKLVDADGTDEKSSDENDGDAEAAPSIEPDGETDTAPVDEAGAPDDAPTAVESDNRPDPSTYRPVFANDLRHFSLGSDDPNSDHELYVEIDPYRAGVHQVQLTHYSESVDGDDRYTVLYPIDLHLEDAPTIGSYAARTITINGQVIPLFAYEEIVSTTAENENTAESDSESTEGDEDALADEEQASESLGVVWHGAWVVTDRSETHITLSLTIVAGPDDAPVDLARLNRTFRVSPGSYTLNLEQTVTNLTNQSMTVVWEQLGQGDIEYTPDYLKGRSQYFVLGYFNNDHDPGHFSISSRDGYLQRSDVVGDVLEAQEDDNDDEDVGVWPREDMDEQAELAWLASTNRFFAIVTSAPVDPESDSENSEAITSLQTLYPTIETSVYPSEKADPDLSAVNRTVMLTLRSNKLTLDPGQTSKPGDLGLDIFAGPRDKKVFAQAPYKSMRFGNLIRYSLGGMCGFCTFAWLADGLLALLKFFHMVTGDWGIAIIVLVLIVRLCLHPLTKRGQISMMKMSKQMAAVAPEIAKLKKKYVDNPQKMQQEQMKLYREKGINPAAGAMGCLPMFFQMPIWIALYAMLYFVIELRHQDAFYGIFQLVSAGHWHFLADLSRSDQFIRFSSEPKLVSLWLITFDYSHINILPLLMGFTFYFNMKLTTPPPTTEQQAQQQKIMKFMPFLFPVMLYSAPSALTLYICASTFAGMVDSYIVRRHIKELEESGELFKPKERKAGGFMDRMSKAVESAQSHRADQAKEQGKNRGTQQKKRKKK